MTIQRPKEHQPIQSRATIPRKNPFQVGSTSFHVNLVISKEEDLPITYGGIMRVGTKEMTIFCVDAFQITNETGSFSFLLLTN